MRRLFIKTGKSDTDLAYMAEPFKKRFGRYPTTFMVHTDKVAYYLDEVNPYWRELEKVSTSEGKEVNFLQNIGLHIYQSFRDYKLRFIITLLFIIGIITLLYRYVKAKL